MQPHFFRRRFGKHRPVKSRPLLYGLEAAGNAARFGRQARETGQAENGVSLAVQRNGIEALCWANSYSPSLSLRSADSATSQLLDKAAKFLSICARHFSR